MCLDEEGRRSRVSVCAVICVFMLLSLDQSCHDLCPLFSTACPQPEQNQPYNWELHPWSVGNVPSETCGVVYYGKAAGTSENKGIKTEAFLECCSKCLRNLYSTAQRSWARSSYFSVNYSVLQVFIWWLVHYRGVLDIVKNVLDFPTLVFHGRNVCVIQAHLLWFWNVIHLV